MHSDSITIRYSAGFGQVFMIASHHLPVLKSPLKDTVILIWF